MLIVPSTADRGGWNDPLIDMDIEIFQRIREEFEELDSRQPEYDQQEASPIGHLCDESRQIVFRLHRITEDEVEGLIVEFRKAIDSIQRIEGMSEQNLNYARFIRLRADRLELILKPWLHRSSD